MWLFCFEKLCIRPVLCGITADTYFIQSYGAYPETEII